MPGTMVADLGIGPQVWLILTLLSFLTLFFKFNRLWSMRNLDLLLLFAPAPGVMSLVGSGASQPWGAFVWLFLAAGIWLVRCLLDLGLSRRPLLEPASAESPPATSLDSGNASWNLQARRPRPIFAMA